MNLGIEGRVALVCASTRGLGLATAQALAAEGARVTICGRNGDRARELAAGLPGALGLQTDLSDPETPARLVEAVGERLGPVEILVLNGGGPPPLSAHTAGDEDLEHAFASLVLPLQRLVRLVLPGMRERRWGRIVAIGSSGIVEPIPQLALSNTGRGALTGLLMTLAREVAADGVTVNVLLPGRIATERVAELDRAAAERAGIDVETVRHAAESAIPAGRYGRPEEFAAVAAFYCGEPAAYATGSLVRVDGGMTRSH